MEFESKLSCETIKQRLITHAQPLNMSNSLTEHQFLFKWREDSSFYLMKTGGSRPVLPFVGRIEARENSTYVVGKFTLAKSAKVVLACFFGCAWILFLFACFLNDNFDITGKIIVFVAIATWTILGYAFFRYVPGLFQKRQQSDVVEFIEKHLLG